MTKRLDQILLPWGDFESVGTQPAGTAATVDYRFRNGRKVRFEAREIDVPRLLADVKAYLESDPRELDWERVDIEQIGWRILAKDDEKYVGRVAAEWDLKLEPRPNHWDRRVPVTTPLKRAGAYLVTARIEGGNEARIVLWLSDAVIVRKPLDGRVWLFVADAETGKPLEIAMALSTKPSVLLLDEADPGGRRQGSGHYRRSGEEAFRKDDHRLIEHTIDVVMQVCKTVTVLTEGQVFAEGTPEEISANKEVQRVYLGEEI